MRGLGAKEDELWCREFISQVGMEALGYSIATRMGNNSCPSLSSRFSLIEFRLSNPPGGRSLQEFIIDGRAGRGEEDLGVKCSI